MTLVKSFELPHYQVFKEQFERPLYKKREMISQN